MFHKTSPLKIVVIVWVIFSVLYVAYNEWNRFKVSVIQSSYNQGVEDAVAKVISEAKTCKVFPINLGESKVMLVSTDCSQQPVPSQNK